MPIASEFAPDVVLVSKAEGERTVLSWDYGDYLREFHDPV